MKSSNETEQRGNATYDAHCLDFLFAAHDQYVAEGGDRNAARLLWCTFPGCRSFEVVDELTCRRRRDFARCPDHEGPR